MRRELRCTELDLLAVAGACPVHGGDRCLYVFDVEEPFYNGRPIVDVELDRGEDVSTPTAPSSPLSRSRRKDSE